MSQVETTPHEVEGRWKRPDWGRGPYDALNELAVDVEIDAVEEVRDVRERI